MITQEYDIKDMNRIYGQEFGVPAGLVLVTTDTGNDMKIDGEWRPDKGLVISVAFLHDNKLEIYYRTNENNGGDFSEAIKTKLDAFERMGFDVWAWNKDTEAGNFFGMFGKHYTINEAKPIERFWKTESFVSIMLENGFVPKFKKQIRDPVTESKNCIKIWEKYVETDNHNVLTDLVEHSIASILKEALLFKNRDKIKDVIESRVKEDGL